MAYTRKTTTKPVSRNDDVETVTEKREFAPDDRIECKSITAGELIFIGKKTGTVYDWSNYGDSAYIEFQDLKAEVHNAKSNYIYSPLFLIEDEEVLALPDFANVRKLYENVISAEEVDELFSLTNQQFRSQLSKLPNGIKNTIKSIARDKIEDGSLDSIQKIKIIDEVLGTDLYNLLGNG